MPFFVATKIARTSIQDQGELVRMQFTCFATSDTGRHRRNNEDSYLCNAKQELFAVADGMGGQASGEIASKVAVQSVQDFVLRSRAEDITWPIPYRKGLSLAQNRLLAAAAHANDRIRNLSKEKPSMKGMGTTLVGATIEGNHLAVVNIGDSRLYRVRDGQIEQITQDHNLAWEQERMGLLTKEEAFHHPQRHILTSALGIELIENIRIDLSRIPIRKKDLFLMCSDGLNDMLSDEEIAERIASPESESLEEMGLSLIREANRAGGKDNITVVLLSFH
jgi:serine/threonine protein phosphatase PrpC